MKRIKNRIGFTLLEITVVLSLVAILAALTVPSLIGFFEAGRQVNRNNIARTLYLAAQNQLTEMRITKGLKAGLSGYYDDGFGGYLDEPVVPDSDKVYDSLEVSDAELDALSPGESENRPFVTYISKAKGDMVSSDAQLIIRLLNPVVMDKTILNDAILIEFNVKTGVVLSVFYSDELESTPMGYTGGDESDVSISSSGEFRYTDDLAKARGQGYYGVNGTGEVLDYTAPYIYLYDSATNSGNPFGNPNYLYAELLIPTTRLNEPFDLCIDGTMVHHIDLSVNEYDGATLSGFTDLASGYTQIFWELDYVGGNTADPAFESIYSIRRYSSSVSFDATQNITVSLQGTGMLAESNPQNPYYLYNTNGVFGVQSARHLFNVRYTPGGAFTQTADIDLEDQIDNFKPIPDFSGTYNGKTISNLIIDVSGSAGLFGTISSGGTVRNLTLDTPNVSGGSNVGAVCGELTGGTIDRAVVSNPVIVGSGNNVGAMCGAVTSGTISTPTVSNPAVSGASNVGGVAGSNAGTITGAYVKYVAGVTSEIGSSTATGVGGIVGANSGTLTDATFVSPNPVVHMSGTGTVGGIAGSNSGTLDSVLSLALAPINSSGDICPIAGNNTGTVGTEAFFLAGTPIRPVANDPTDSTSLPASRIDYNGEPDNGVGTGLGTAELRSDAKIPDWGMKALTMDPEDPDNQVYPYRYHVGSYVQLAAHPDWPIAEGGDETAFLTYYEVYGSGSPGYEYDETIRDTLVMHDGYLLDVTDFTGSLTLTIGTSEFTITDGEVDDEDWVFSTYTATGEDRVRIYIPNDVWETASGGAEITVSLTKGSKELLLDAGDNEIKINPMFAPEEYGLIRSPRHIQNISSALNKDYEQQLDVDFAAYYYDVSDTSSHLTYTDSAVVTGKFTGTYDGNGKKISNLTINADTVETGIGLFEKNSGTITGVTLVNANITGNNDVGGVAGTNNNTIIGTTMTNCVISGSGNVGGIAGSSVGTVEQCLVENGTVEGADNVGGIAGIASASITDCKTVDTTVDGSNNVGGIAGSSSGAIERANVSFREGSTDTISGSDNIGGIAGASSNRIADCTVVSPTNNRHIVGGTSTTIGGIVGVNSGVLQSCKFLALAPRFGDVINPIAGTSGGTADYIYYLSGIPKRPAKNDLPIGENYNMNSVNIAGLGEGLSTIGMYHIDDTGNLPENWIKPEELDDSVILSEANETYPYPHHTDNAEKDTARPAWPIVEDVGAFSINDFYYYEKYADNTYGIWGLRHGSTDGSLDNTKQIVEAGYAIILDEKLEGQYLYVANDDGVWYRVSSSMMNFADETDDFARGIISAAVGVSGTYVCALPLGALADRYGRLNAPANDAVKQCNPVMIMHTGDSSNNAGRFTGAVGSIKYINGYVQPLFAKGIYEDANPSQFTVRTPWQLINIGRLTNGSSNPPDPAEPTDFTAGKTFVQGRGIDFTHTGTGVSNDGKNTGEYSTTEGTMVYSIVNGDFFGTYDGQNNIIDHIKITASGTQTGLFAVNAAGAVIKNVKLQNLELKNQGQLGAITGTNAGLIENCSVDKVKINDANTQVGGIAGENLKTGVLKDVRITDSTIAAQDMGGGITGQNLGIIDGGTVEDTTVNINNATGGGVTAQNDEGAEITGVKVTEVIVDSGSNASNRGGVAGINKGVIEDCNVKELTVNYSSGSNLNAGGIAGTNNGDVLRVNVDSSIVNGERASGGIAGENTALIENSKVINTKVSSGNSAGGMVGVNTDTVKMSGVEYSTIYGQNGEYVGGIVGNNSGADSVITDVYFLSVDSEDATKTEENGQKVTFLAPVVPITTGNVNKPGGGIVGNNDGKVSYAFYLAPAPGIRDTSYRNPNDSTITSSLTIYPIVQSGNKAEKSTVMVDGEEEVNDTCFYLWGSRYTFDNWITWYTETQYNRAATAIEQLMNPNGGKGLISKFIDKEWLGFAYNASLENWYQSVSGYPYPMLRNGMTAPEKWVNTEAPVRLDQVDRKDNEWAATISANTVGTVDFINAEFESLLTNPNNSSETYPVYNAGGWVINIPAHASGGTGDFWTYNYMAWIPGWSTRPVDVSNNINTGYGNGFWNCIEFQRPNSSSTNGRTRTNYEGTMTGLYAELNADLPGTLYQICPTTPGTELYYSFYHASRNNNTTDSMNFYLSGMVSRGNEWAYDANGLTIIRPCTTKRGNQTGTPLTRDTIAYGRVNFYDPSIKGLRTAYLYDVWIGGLTGTSGYGITFWSNYNYTAANIGNGVASINNLYQPNGSTFRADAVNNVIGYWDVKYFTGANGTPTNRLSEWKQYYGTYTIPQGQVTTEFAYQSNSGTQREGNYLDGITFQSPGFLTVDKYIKFKNSTEDAKYVKPGDTLTVELHVKNHGEVAVNSIVLKDQLHPYTRYIEYAGNASTDKGTVSATYSNGDVTLTLNSGTTLAKGETMVVRFDIKVLVSPKNEVGETIEQSTTLQYYFRNQAVVEYKDYAFGNGYAGSLAGYTGKAKMPNASGEPIKVSIDPVKLTKTITNISDVSGLTQPVDDEEFTVTLTVENTQEADGSEVKTKGLITLLIPAGFELISEPDGAVIDKIEGGVTRVTVQKVNLSAHVKSKTYTYTLKYTGGGYGVAYDSITADYKYVFYDEESGDDINVLMDFPKTVVGIRVKAVDVDLTLATEDLVPALDGSPGGMTFKHFPEPGVLADMALIDSGYKAKPEIILCDENGNPAETNNDGNYQITYPNAANPEYTAVLNKSSNELVITPAPSGGDKTNGWTYGNDEYTLYYRILLTADKSGSPDFVLDSEVKTITVTVTDNSMVDPDDPDESDDGDEVGNGDPDDSDNLGLLDGPPEPDMNEVAPSMGDLDAPLPEESGDDGDSEDGEDIEDSEDEPDTGFDPILGLPIIPIVGLRKRGGKRAL